MLRLIVRFMFSLLVVSLSACSNQKPASELNTTVPSDITIIISSDAALPVKLTAEDLKTDLQTVLNNRINLISDKEILPESAHFIVLGQAENLIRMNYLPDSDKTFINSQTPADRGGLIRHTTIADKPSVLLTGRDIQGTQYMVYDYSELVLGIDKLAYWSGSQAAQIHLQDILSFKNQSIAPPVVPLLVYFENDVDELANLKKPYLEYDWQNFTQMIDSLVRLRYNGIEFFDMLGRVEFYTRPEYLKMHPDYQLDIDYLNRMIDYVHAKGMYVQIDMMMGRQLLNLSEKASTCWRDHKQEWIDTWHHYLTKTPVAKADIFALRPRNQVWDWEYVSSCGEDKAQVFNQVYRELEKVVNQYKPDSTKVCTCYHDGMEIFNQDFNPPKSFIIAWSDNGWGGFDYLPESTKGYRFGTYMHAGFWLNHDVADPYPELVDKTMDMMYSQYQATDYMMVNGQTFRPFILNLEAFAESARLGTAFDGEAFYQAWAQRYFGEDQAKKVVSAMKGLHQAHHNQVGYVEILWQIKKMTAYLSDSPLQRPGRSAVPVSYDGVTDFFEGTQSRINALKQSQSLIDEIEPKLTRNQVFFHDYVSLPIAIYLDLLKFNQNLIELSKLKGLAEQNPEAVSAQSIKNLLIRAEDNLIQIYKRRANGDLDPKWHSWYAVDKRRPNNGFPSVNTIKKIRQSLQNEIKR